MENLKQLKNELEPIVSEMRGWAELNATMNPSMIQRIADRIDSAFKDPATVFAILRDYHNAHYSVFPRDELTERLCHAFYDQFVVKPNTEGV